MTSKHVIRESESPRPIGLVDSDFTNDAFLGHYPIQKPNQGNWPFTDGFDFIWVSRNPVLLHNMS